MRHLFTALLVLAALLTGWYVRGYYDDYRMHAVLREFDAETIRLHEEAEQQYQQLIRGEQP